MAIPLSTTPDTARLPLKGWAVTAAILLVAGVSAELFLRSGAFWRLPLPYITRENDDVHARTGWRIVNLPPRDNEIVVLGASTADAVIEPQDKLQQPVLDRVLGPGRATLVNFTVNRSCYAEQVVVADNFLQHGHRPKLVLLFSWPGCASRDPDADDLLTLTAARTPLVSRVLDSSVPYESLDDAIERYLTYHVDLVRYRYFINGWLRERTQRALHGGLNPWLPFRASNRRQPWPKSWPEDEERYGQIRRYAERLRTEGPAVERLEFLLQFLKSRGLPVLVVESPWSPPMRTEFAAGLERYREAVSGAATRQGAAYFDPNAVVELTSGEFHDSYHVTPKGAARYMEAVAEHLRGIVH